MRWNYFTNQSTHTFENFEKLWIDREYETEYECKLKLSYKNKKTHSETKNECKVRL